MGRPKYQSFPLLWYHARMDENPYNAPREHGRLADSREPRPPEWPRTAGSLFAFGVIGLVLALTGNENQFVWLSVMMIVAGAGSAIGHWRQSK